jgi:hypothetical protein
VPYHRRTKKGTEGLYITQTSHQNHCCSSFPFVIVWCSFFFFWILLLLLFLVLFVFCFKENPHNILGVYLCFVFFCFVLFSVVVGRAPYCRGSSIILKNLKSHKKNIFDCTLTHHADGQKREHAPLQRASPLWGGVYRCSRCW